MILIAHVVAGFERVGKNSIEIEIEINNIKEFKYRLVSGRSRESFVDLYSV